MQPGPIHVCAGRDQPQGYVQEEASRNEQLEVTKSLLSKSSNGEVDFGTLAGRCKASLRDDPRIGTPKRILVVGGGPAGLISLHELLSTHNRPEGTRIAGEIQLYERRAEVGGVWYFEPENEVAKKWQRNTHGWRVAREEAMNGESAMDTGKTSTGSSRSIGRQGTSIEEKSQGPDGFITVPECVADPNFCWISRPRAAPRWPSPAYDGLIGNGLLPLLEFSAKPMPEPAEGLFPSMAETHDYLLDFATPLRPYIKTCQEVVKIEPKLHARSERVSWSVTNIDWRDGQNGKETIEEWDCVMVAVGAYDYPFWPDIPGLTVLRKQRSPLIMHAKTYAGPNPFRRQYNKIVVVGNGNSGNDIAAQLAPLNSSGPLYRCARHDSYFAHLPDARIEDVAPIANIEHSNGKHTLKLDLTDGTEIEGVTAIIFATGYEYQFEWIQVPAVDCDIANHKLESTVLETASKYGAVPNLYNTTFLAAAPTLSFIGLSAGSSPIPTAEIQARATARAWNNMLQLPSTMPELLADYHERAAELGLSEDCPAQWRRLHMVRGPPERKIVQALLDMLERSEAGSSGGLFRWDARREGVIERLRRVKEGELRRLRDLRASNGNLGTTISM